MSVLYDDKKESLRLDQVIVEIDAQNGLFKFVELNDILTAFSPKKDKHEVIDLMLTYGALYNFSIVVDTSINAFANTVNRMSKQPNQDFLDILGIKNDQYNQVFFAMIKVLFNLAPILDQECQLGCLSKMPVQESTNYRKVMGLCFNDEIFF